MSSGILHREVAFLFQGPIIHGRLPALELSRASRAAPDQRYIRWIMPCVLATFKHGTK